MKTPTHALTPGTQIDLAGIIPAECFVTCPGGEGDYVSQGMITVYKATVEHAEKISDSLWEIWLIDHLTDARALVVSDEDFEYSVTGKE